MKQIFTAATVDEAKNKAAVEFGTEVEKITFTVLEEPKKGFFGKIKGEAKVEAEYEPETKVETVTEKTEAVEEKAEVQEEVKAEAEWSDTLQKKADCAKSSLALTFWLCSHLSGALNSRYRLLANNCLSVSPISLYIS